MVKLGLARRWKNEFGGAEDSRFVKQEYCIAMFYDFASPYRIGCLVSIEVVLLQILDQSNILRRPTKLLLRLLTASRIISGKDPCFKSVKLSSVSTEHR